MSKNLLSTNGLSFERLRAFLEISEARGISRAAKGNSSRQSQFSRQLTELEAFFGTPLVNRGRGIAFSLTETGRRLKAVTAQHFAALEELKQRSAHGPLTFRIGAGEIVLTWLVIPVLATMSTLPKNLRISLMNRRSTDIIKGISEGTLELGVIRREPIAAGLRCVALGTIPKVIVSSAGLNRNRTETLMIASMEDGTHDELSSSPQGVKGETIFSCSSYQQMYELVHRGACAAELPVFMAEGFSSRDFRLDKIHQSKTDWKLQIVSDPELDEYRPAAGKLVNELTKAFRARLATSPRP